MNPNLALERLHTISTRIAQACAQARRPVDSVRLLAVSKTFALPAVLQLAGHGQNAFGENYVQEGVEKIEQARSQKQTGFEWHFIGPLQSNKTRAVAQAFDWVQSIDRLKIAQRLSEQRLEQRSEQLKPLQVCIQVNISHEPTKSGCQISEVTALASAVQTLPNLTLRGLMAIPEAPQGGMVGAALEEQYLQMSQLFRQLQSTHGSSIDTLSMGMSADLEIAIAHGSTMVRVGSALFGARS
jgi:PLP dependent protein